jgi:hypothetical protein
VKIGYSESSFAIPRGHQCNLPSLFFQFREYDLKQVYYTWTLLQFNLQKDHWIIMKITGSQETK